MEGLIHGGAYVRNFYGIYILSSPLYGHWLSAAHCLFSLSQLCDLM